MHLDELCTHVPPRRIRVPDDGGMGVPLGDVVEDAGTEAGSWFRLATVRASSYVVPPIMNTITSCGLQTDQYKYPGIFRHGSHAVGVTNSGPHPVVPLQMGSSCLSAGLVRDVLGSGIDVEHAEYTHSPRPKGTREYKERDRRNNIP